MNPVRALLINENIGGHATVHHHLRTVAARRSDIELRIVDVPPPGFWRKVAAVPVPGLAGLDADLRPVRYQLAQSAWVAARVAGWSAAYQPDVVHLYTHNAGLLARRHLAQLPYVVTIDSTNAQSNRMQVAREPTRFSGLTTAAVRPFERRVYRDARRVVANSAWCARSLIEDYDLDPARIETLPMGVPVPPLQAGSARETGALPRIMFVGRTLARKGGLDLLEVHRRWLADRCELVLVTREPVAPSRNVTVVGDAVAGDGTVDALLAGADLFVLPSRLDQWPNAVMEAMAQGVTPVVSAVGGLPEMVLGGRAGVILPDLSQETLRDTLIALLEDPARRRALGDRARRRVVEDLDVERTAGRLLDVMCEAAATRVVRAGT